MFVTVYNIKARKRRLHFSPLKRFHHKLTDFSLQKAESISADAFLEQDVVPYWINFDTKQVIFAWVKDVLRLSRASFITDVIYEFAEKLYFVPFSLFFMLANKIQTLKTGIILGLYTPRSGSTLVCKLLSQAKSVFVMSEPVCLNLIERHYSLKSSFGQEFFKGLILFFSHFARRQGKAQLYIKPLALSDFNMVDDLFGIQTKKIITWRDPFETIKSILEKRPFVLRRIFSAFKFLRKASVLSFEPVDTYEKLINLFDKKKLSSLQMALIFAWIFPMMEIGRLIRGAKVQPLVLSYPDFTKVFFADLSMLVLNYLGLQDDYTKDMIDELSRDSQAGTSMARDKKHPFSIGESKMIKTAIERFLDCYTLDLTLPCVIDHNEYINTFLSNNNK